jgi:hypothetical protein
MRTTLVISGSRLAGSTSSRMVRQSIEFHIPEYAGPGPYEAAIGSMFLVVGVDTRGKTDSDMDAAVVEALTKAKHLQLAGAKVVIESANDTEIVGRFSFDRGPTNISNGRFRALVKARK